jgi:hypothetical protein
MCLFPAALLTIGSAGRTVAAGDLLTNDVESRPRFVQMRLSREPARRVGEAVPNDVPVSDRDDYVEILTKAGIADLPPGR